MNSPYDANPFEALRLDPGAGAEEAVGRAGELRRRAADEAEVAAIRRAVQALTADSGERALHALFTHPAPAYRSTALERFAAAYRRPPAPADSAPLPCPPFEAAEVVAVLCAAAAELWPARPLPFEEIDGGAVDAEAAAA